MTFDVRETRPLENSHPVNNQHLVRKAKMLMIMPLLMLPFLTFAFWALGGGKGVQIAGRNTNEKKGLNPDLPSARIKDDSKEDKLTFYEEAQQDEEKSSNSLREDGYYQLHPPGRDSNRLDNVVSNGYPKYDPTPKNPYTGLNTSPISPGNYQNPNEEKIMNRLKQLQDQVNNPSPNQSIDKPYRIEGNAIREENSNADLIERRMNTPQNTDKDPELQQLDGMLDKILTIQHPERLKEQARNKSMEHKSAAFVVTGPDNKASVSLFGDTSGKEMNSQSRFYGTPDATNGENNQNAIEAAILETQTLTNGSNVKLRLLNDIYVNGRFIPKGTFLFGVASLQGERLKIDISSIKYNNSLFPIKLNVYDLDGLPGINVPGALGRDVAKQSANNSLQSMELNTLNPSLAAQAAAAGISTAKSLLTRKVKLVKVTVKANYKVLLQNMDTNAID